MIKQKCLLLVLLVMGAIFTSNLIPMENQENDNHNQRELATDEYQPKPLEKDSQHVINQKINV